METAAVAAEVTPGYEGRVAFVNLVLTDERAQDLLRAYPIEYIPTSVFVDGQGQVVESFVGPLDEQQMRARLDSLARSAD